MNQKNKTKKEEEVEEKAAISGQTKSISHQQARKKPTRPSAKKSQQPIPGFPNIWHLIAHIEGESEFLK